MCAPGTGIRLQGTSGSGAIARTRTATTLRPVGSAGARASTSADGGSTVKTLSDRARSATSPWSATAGPARRRWPRRCSLGPAPSTGWGGSRTARRSTDFDPEEQKRGSRLSLALAPFEWEGHKVNLIDTPRLRRLHRRRAGRARVADLAVFVVSAVEGVEVQTEAIWKIAAELGIPRMVFVNKLDRERASFERTLDAAARPFGAGIAPLELPDRRGGRVPRRRRSAHRQRRSSTRAARTTDGEIPDELADARAPGARQPRRGHRRRRRRAAGALPRRRRCPRSTSSSTRSRTASPTASVFPVVVRLGRDRRRASTGSPTSSARSARRPPTVRRVDGDRRRHRAVEVAADADGRAAGVRVQDDRRPLRRPASRCSRCCRARSSPTTTSSNPRTGTDERLHGLFTLRGKEQEPVTERARRRHRRGGEALRHRDRRHARAEGHAGARRADRAAAAGARASRSAPAPQADEDKLGQRAAPPAGGGPGARRRAQRGDAPDAAAGHGRDPPARSPSSSSARKFGVDVDTEEVRVPYRETITQQAEAEGKYKKQSGGHGQFGVAWHPRRAARPGRAASSSSTRSSAARSPGSSSPRCRRASRRRWRTGGVLRLPGRRREGRRASTASTTPSTRRR